MDKEENSKVGESNPIGNKLNVNVSIPKQIKIELVDASTLSDLEVWIFIASLLSNFVVGFAVAFVQTESNDSSSNVLLYVAILFSVLLIFAGFMVWRKYKKLNNEKNSFDLEVRNISQQV